MTGPVSHVRRRGRSRRDERGAVLVVSAIAMVALLAIVAIVIDIGYAKQYRRLSQNSADAAALAAAQDLDGTAAKTLSAVVTAKTWAQKNDPTLTPASWTGCTNADALPYTPDPNNSCISFAADYLTVRVMLPTVTQPVFFGGVVGSKGLAVNATATATKTAGAATATAGPCGLCVIAGKTLQIAGNTAIAVTGGEIQADRLTANANDSNSAITPVPLKWYQSNGSNWGRNVQPAPATFNSRYAQLAAPVPNPFAGKTVDYTGLVTDGSNINHNGGTSPISPNRIYTQNVNINGGTLTLAPGTYYFANTLTLQGGAKLIGDGVTLVFSCRASCASVGGEPGKFNFGQGTTVEITAPTSGPYAGLAIMFDPDGTQGTPNQLSGTITLNGAVYAKQAGFNMGSSSAVIKAWTIVSGGNFDANNGTLLIDNNAFANATGGGSGAGGSTGGSISLVG
ncbi:MAG TPA: pilus assembly protein TadG-related protein [Acidimicrobiales bacterium]|nr:pilus assembly protein TadG-related protein [Acidimicrobiales bacterium]